MKKHNAIAAALALVAGVSSVYGYCYKEYVVVCQNYNDWITNMSYPSPTCNMTYTTGAYAETTVYKPDVKVLASGVYSTVEPAYYNCVVPIKWYNSCTSSYEHGTFTRGNVIVTKGKEKNCTP